MQSMSSIETLAHDIKMISSEIVSKPSSNVSRSLLIQALDCSTVSMIICAADDLNTIIYVNNAFVEDSGYSKEEAIGQPFCFLQGRDTECPEVSEVFDAKVSAEISLIECHKDGTCGMNRLRLSPVLDCDGVVYAFIVVKVVKDA